MDKKIRVCAYARVSTEKDEQMNSLENQKKYFADKILSEPDWEFVDIFYDEGVSGTSTDARRGFNRMIEECRVGHVDLILTKEVSRFARNTVDTLNYTRRLREYNVEVFFINDNMQYAHYK